MAQPLETEAHLRAFIDANRVRCLWFLRRDYYPSSDAETCRVLEYIERHGDQAAARRAATLRQWLSQRSSEGSAVS